MNKLDEQYFELAKDILKNGTRKSTRSGDVISVFGRQIRHKLSDGFPLLTTKKVFYRGMIHELLWFIKGDTNIRYLVKNDVHIWDDDAYRAYLELVSEHNKYASENNTYEIVVCLKEKFIEHCKNGDKMMLKITPKGDDRGVMEYTFGDLGPIYGHQWRNWNDSIDQLKNVIETLKVNPNDRRLLVSAWNVSDIPFMALPPCHYCYQFYTRKLSFGERIEWFNEHFETVHDAVIDDKWMDNVNVPKYELSLMWNQRSVDCGLGLCINVSSYSLLLSMVAQCVNMTCGEVIGNLGDTHIYMNHIEGITKQMENDPYKYDLPTLELNKDIKNIDDFTFDDIKIVGYESYNKIYLPLSVGL